MVHADIGNILVLSKNDFSDLYKALQKIDEVGLKLNTEALFYRFIENEDLAFCISKDGEIPLALKVEAIKAFDSPSKACGAF